VRRPQEGPSDYAQRLAQEKALKVAEQFPRAWVLGADTIVVVDEQVLEKPQDDADAARMLRTLSGRAHQVTTAVALAGPHKRIDTRACTTKVYFRQLEEKEIQDYIAGREPMDKAGAYAIQGGAARWVVRLEGDYSNVVGLPLPVVTGMLRASGFFGS
jgi:septum formation protein